MVSQMGGHDAGIATAAAWRWPRSCGEYIACVPGGLLLLPIDAPRYVLHIGAREMRSRTRKNDDDGDSALRGEFSEARGVRCHARTRETTAEKRERGRGHDIPSLLQNARQRKLVESATDTEQAAPLKSLAIADPGGTSPRARKREPDSEHGREALLKRK